MFDNVKELVTNKWSYIGGGVGAGVGLLLMGSFGAAVVLGVGGALLGGVLFHRNGGTGGTGGGAGGAQDQK